MPTVMRAGGFRLSFYSNDHEPAHVHCINGDGEVVVCLLTGEPRSLEGMRACDARAAVRLVRAHRLTLLGAWNDFDQKRRETR